MIVALAVLALLAASCSSSGDTTDTANTAAATDVTFESAGDPNAIVALPTLDRSETDPAVGMAAPRIEGTGYDGETIVLGAEGAPQVIAFLAHWCPHCQDEMPVVNDWIASGAVPAGVEVVGVATSISPDRDNYPPEDWFAADGPLLPGLPDPDNTIAANYGMPGFPYWVAVNADGTVAARAAGNLSVDVMQQLADMVANSTPPT